MELQQLKYFQVVAIMENVTQAAEALHISQPALSKSLHKLEEEYGHELFDRRGRNLRLNEYGKILLSHTDTIFQEISKSRMEIEELSQNRTETITLLINTALTTLPQLVASFAMLHPDVRFNLWQRESMPANSRYDFSLDVSMAPRDDQNHVTVLTEKIVLAVSDTHPLAQRGSIRLAEAAGERFISLSRSSVFRQMMDRYCQIAGIEHTVVLESFNYRNSKELVRLNMGVSLFPEHTWGHIDEPGLTLLKITDPPCVRHLILSWPEDSDFSPIQEEFRKYFIRFFRDLAERYELAEED